nr:MAG TPA: hypothetical protein [Caudoviricetes sp.]DAM49798.1 MAG TPA: hypothetical protein [Caudoviricetes sp.]DAP04313.1 MAG TPA: hypothetical protein [Caudoviricetes sp.]DAV83329.1 MAG TPA: hypothetical protein [Caudoviricetes sp.]
MVYCTAVAFAVTDLAYPATALYPADTLVHKDYSYIRSLFHLPFMCKLSH